jgi:predicted Rossmann fold nucleotide-binding protein DprA/Smf involved in DNA uptake
VKSIEPFDIHLIDLHDSSSPLVSRDRLVAAAFRRIWAIGDLKILENHLIAFFCSSKSPGQVIVRIYDLARSLRDAGKAVIGGFHSPMEKECLEFLLRGEQPIVICPARSIDGMRLPPAWRKAISGKRLLLLSPFEHSHRRPTNALAETRNRLAATIADTVLVAHATEGGKLEGLCMDLMTLGKSVYTLDITENISLIKMGAAIHPDLSATMACASRGRA